MQGKHPISVFACHMVSYSKLLLRFFSRLYRLSKILVFLYDLLVFFQNYWIIFHLWRLSQFLCSNTIYLSYSLKILMYPWWLEFHLGIKLQINSKVWSAHELLYIQHRMCLVHFHNCLFTIIWFWFASIKWSMLSSISEIAFAHYWL